jgi:glycosyltransferase involved in cell wall biosynthesis
MVTPEVSVVIIFWNAEPFLLEAINIIIAQTFPDWELILVDDGSTDGSTATALRYVEQDPARILYFQHPGHENRGMSASRNLGLRQGKGKYVAFLDADDVLFPLALAEQVNALSDHPEAVMVYGPVQKWYSWTGKDEDLGRDVVEKLGVQTDTVIQPPRLLTLFLQDRATVPSGFLIRREAAERAGGFEETFRGLYEDQVFCTKICLKQPVVASYQCWYRYRQHPGSTCQSAKRQGVYTSARPIFLSWLAAYLKAEGIGDKALWNALYSELWPFQHPIRHWFNHRVYPYLVQTARRKQ